MRPEKINWTAEILAAELETLRRRIDVVRDHIDKNWNDGDRGRLSGMRDALDYVEHEIQLD